MTDTAARLDAIADGFRDAQLLLTANRLGLFAAIGRGVAGAEELAERLGADRRGMRVLCDALAALGLLDKDAAGGYRNGELALAHLLPDSPRPRAAMLAHRARIYDRWGKLADAVVGGAPVPDEALDPRLAEDAEAFARAMADVGRESAVATAAALDLDGVGRLLDLGGGPGLYAIELARRNPGLTAAVFDRPDTVGVARGNIERAGLAGRVGTVAGDLFEDDLGGPWDLVFASNLVHIYSADDNRRLVARCAAALAPGGRLVLKDFFLDPDRTTPAGGALFAVHMLVSTEGGGCYTVEEADGWLTAAGLEPEPAVDLTAQSRLLIGRKASV
jgi:predicted O-methyltransferase YrrM